MTQTLSGGSLAGLIQVVGVVTDDLPKDLAGYPTVPVSGKPWIHSLGLCGPDGVPVTGLTVNIPSTFRSMPLSDKQGRAAAKEGFEQNVLEFMTGLRADVLLSDHYMARIDHLHRLLPGRVLNIHPGITLLNHPYAFPGKTPTADAIARAAKEEEVRTGATIHFVDSKIDHGPAIAFSQATPVYGDDQPQWLRYRNYQMAKLPVLGKGLALYARNLYPGLSKPAIANIDLVEV